jgi:electron transport complex protein RnfG
MMLLGQSITRNSLLLGVFAIVTTLVIAGTYLSTRERIAQQIRQAEQKALLEIVPHERHDNSMLDDTLAVGPEADGLGLKGEKAIYLARQQGEVVAAILPVVAPDAYSGEIELIVGVNADGTVAGVRALTHRETPGLGDKVDLKKSDWVLGFNGKSLQNPQPDRWAVKKDKGVFDQFTGATITPRAVVAATRRALEYTAAHRAAIFSATAATYTPQGDKDG